MFEEYSEENDFIILGDSKGDLYIVKYKTLIKNWGLKKP